LPRRNKCKQKRPLTPPISRKHLRRPLSKMASRLEG